MTFLSMIAVLAATGWIGWSIERRFRQRPYSRAWNIGATILAVAGVALGFWFVTHTRMASPTVRVFGFPFHLGGSDLIDGRWFSGASTLAPFAGLAGIALGVGICLLPLRIAQFISERRVTDESAPTA